jgi:hypothetical protein
MLPAHNPSIRLTNSIEFGVIVLTRARERRSQDESEAMQDFSPGCLLESEEPSTSRDANRG